MDSVHMQLLREIIKLLVSLEASIQELVKQEHEQQEVLERIYSELFDLREMNR